MKRTFSMALLLVFALSCTLFAFTSCNQQETSDKQIPVYQGMTITKSGTSTAALASVGHHSGGIMLLNADNGNQDNNGKGNDQGNHYGHYKGDHADRNDDLDEDNPFPENGDGQNIEEEIQSSLNVVGSPDTIYYAQPNEDIYINIHIDNPDSFEIMSFTLNGKKYSSYMFEQGSDMETIILKYNVGDAAGIVEYTIDAIKYVDGTEIKDVLIDGNKTVMAGVKTDNQVAASVSDVKIGTNALSFGVNVKDHNELVQFSQGVLKAVLYDGFRIVSEKDIEVGDNAVTFDGLKTNTLYQYAIVGYYDDLSGVGLAMNVLYKDAFYTNAVVLFDQIVVEQESISFGYIWDEDHQGKAISALKLYKGDVFVRDLAADATTVGELLSNTTYKIVAEYPNAEQTESIYLEFATFAKAAPDFTITNTAKGQESLEFSVNVTDTDGVGEITKVELIHGADVTELENTAEQVLKNLLSNNDYTVKVTYTYDLNDGAGKQTLVKELTATTQAKAAPDFTITNTAKGQESLEFSVNVTDTDGVGEITKVELIHGADVTELENTAEQVLKNLLSNNDYTVKVTYTYDLNDGAGKQTLVKELTATTQAKAAPDFTITNTAKGQESLEFSVNVTDTDGVGEITKVELIHGADVTELENTAEQVLKNLLSNNDYTVKVTYTYDLNDGAGKQTLVKELTATTQAKAAPSFTVKNAAVTTDCIRADYDVTDTDGILVAYKVELYRGGALVAENAERAIDFASLSYYTAYTVRITYDYDLNDGRGVQTSILESTHKTLPYIDVLECTVANTSAVSEGETIFMSVKLDNPLNMAIESVVINGQTYAVTGASTKNKIFVEIVYNGQFAGGDTYLKIDTVKAAIDDVTLQIAPKSELSDNVFINGKLEVLKIEYVNENFEPIEWAFPSDTVYMMITLNNPTGYQVDLFDGNKEPIRLDDNHWYYDVTYRSTYGGWDTAYVGTLCYSNQHINKTVNSTETAMLYRLKSDETIYIRNAEDLMNMDERYACYFELTNDIDLSGIEWRGASFCGVFEGNGYAIKNMTFVGTIKNGDAYLGLFTSAVGVIMNTNIQEATIIADLIADDRNDYDAYVGLFSPLSEGNPLSIINCSVDEYSTVSVTNTTLGATYLGGFVGRVSYTDVVIRDSQNYASIVSNNTNENTYVGGLIGSLPYYSGLRIENCLYAGYVKGVYAGGLVGFAGDYLYVGDTDIYILNSVSSGIVEGCVVGGLIGVVNNNTAEYKAHFVVENCMSIGTIITSSAGGGLVFYVMDATTIFAGCITNTTMIAKTDGAQLDGFVITIYDGILPTTVKECYSTHPTGNENVTICTASHLNSKFFYTETLGWSEDVWDFSMLDVENGQYPVLKNKQ